MSIIKQFLRQIASSEYRGDVQHSDYVSNNGNEYKTDRKSGGGLFVLASILSVMFFILFGIYELLFQSPLATWFQGVWQSVMKTSPQSLVQIPNQIVASESVMQKTVGDWLGLIPGSFGQIWAIIFSPLGAVAGLLLVFLAFVVRLGGRFIFRGQANNSVVLVKIVSWLVLGVSFVPLLLEYCF